MSEYSHIHHVFTKSISGFHIFRTQEDFTRMIRAIRYYQYTPLPMPFSNFERSLLVHQQGFESALTNLVHARQWPMRVEVLSYCLMHTHLHLIINEKMIGGLPRYMADLLNSYSRYFNLRYQRKGPLWQGKYGRFSVEGQESLLRVAVYVHLNPVTSYLVEAPENWSYSSYNELSQAQPRLSDFCVLDKHLEMSPKEYRTHISTQITPLSVPSHFDIVLSPEIYLITIEYS